MLFLNDEVAVAFLLAGDKAEKLCAAGGAGSLYRAAPLPGNNLAGILDSALLPALDAVRLHLLLRRRCFLGLRGRF